MSLKKLPKKKNFKFLDLETNAAVCEFNTCYTKFKESSGFEIKTPAWNNYKPIKHPSFFHQCEECNRKVANSDDKNKTIHAHTMAIAGHRIKMTIADYKYSLIIIKEMIDKTLDPLKIKMMNEAVKLVEKKINKLEKKNEPPILS